MTWQRWKDDIIEAAAGNFVSFVSAYNKNEYSLSTYNVCICEYNYICMIKKEPVFSFNDYLKLDQECFIFTTTFPFTKQLMWIIPL